MYYDIDTHCDNGFTDFNLKCAYLSLKFDRMSDVPESEKLNIPVNTMQEIVDACKKYIATKPTTERQLFRNVCTYISKDKDAEIERLKALLDQHKIAY